MVVQLVRAYQDVKSQVAMGASVDELLERTTRLALMQVLGSVSPAQLRQMAARLAEAANQLAKILEGTGEK